MPSKNSPKLPTALPVAQDIQEALIEGARSGKYAVIVTDHQKPNEPVIYVNKAYEELTGFKLAEVIGLQPHFLQTNDRDQAGVRELEVAIKSGKACCAVLRALKKDGTPSWYQISISPVLNSDGKLTHFVGWLRDITEMVGAKQAEEDLDTYLATLVHDLRTPLAGADRMFALILEGAFGGLTPELLKTITLLSNSNKKALSMVVNLLETFRLQQGVQLMHFQPVILADLIQGAVLEVKAANDFKLHSFRVLIDENFPVCSFDRLSISRLLTNLLDNAVKFSPDGSEILISAEIMADDTFVLKIKDSGIGIAPEDREMIFKKCKRGTKQRRFAPGCGLGLYTCCQIVKAHHGKISCASEVGVGTTFAVLLPIEP